MQKSCKILLILSVLLAVKPLSAQNKTKDKSNSYKTNIEFMALPAIFFNSLSIGVSKQITVNRERVFTLTGQTLWFEAPLFSSVVARYNYNIYLKSSGPFTAYVPLWCGARYVFCSGGGESDTRPYQLILNTMGTGIGLKYEFKNRHKIRFELGVGASVYYVNNTINNLSGFGLRGTDSFLPAFRGGFKYLIPLGKS